MGYYWLPVLKKCCCCVHSLKTASLIIIFLVIIFNFADIFVAFRPVCFDLYIGDKQICDLLKIVAYIYFSSQCVSIIVAFVFYFGIHHNWLHSAHAFMLLIFVNILIRTTYYTIAIFRFKTDVYECGFIEKEIEAEVHLNVFGDNFEIGGNKIFLRQRIIDFLLIYYVFFIFAMIINLLFLYYLLIVNSFSYEMEIGYDDEQEPEEDAKRRIKRRGIAR